MTLGRPDLGGRRSWAWLVGAALMTLACGGDPGSGRPPTGGGPPSAGPGVVSERSEGQKGTPSITPSIAPPIESSAAPPVARDPDPLADRERFAYGLIDLTTGAVLVEANEAMLDTPVSPGSIAKIPVALGAFEAGVLDEQTALMCRRVWTSDGRRYVCSHPDLGRPIGPIEALAHSCNYFFATIAARLPRTALDAAFVTLGWPRPERTAPSPAVGLGLEGTHVTPRAMLAVMDRLARLAAQSGPHGEAARVIIEGLRGAAVEGTAAALGRAGIDAVAKTGTAPMPGGGFQGLVIAAWPSAAPTRAAVVVMPGGAGYQAAEAAAALILEQRGKQQRTREQPTTEAETTVTVGTLERIGTIDASGTHRVSPLRLEDYVARVVAGEREPAAGPSALEALAITARTYALANRDRHREEGFDFCDLTHCQVIRPSTDATRAAAHVTRGRVLLDRGRPASVFYTASCGGRIAASSEVWPALARPYLEARDDPACAATEPWEAEVPAPDLVRALHAAGWVGPRLLDLAVSERTGSGRVARVAVDGLVPPEITGEAFRLAVGRSLGWHLVKSAAFEVRRTGRGYRFQGQGAGHGVGLCVVGSTRRAQAGATVADILAFYFPGLEVGRVAGPDGQSSSTSDIRVALPPSERGRYREVASLAERLLMQLSEELAVSVPDRIDVRFHPTVEAYQRATDRPWWTSAAAMSDRVDLIPLRVLDARGTLASTLRHELVHVLTAPVLGARPVWVQEGAAAFFAGEFTDISDVTSCPDDREFEEAGSGDALARLYERSAACVGRALSDGEPWPALGQTARPDP